LGFAGGCYDTRYVGFGFSLGRRYRGLGSCWPTPCYSSCYPFSYPYFNTFYPVYLGTTAYVYDWGAYGPLAYEDTLPAGGEAVSDQTADAQQPGRETYVPGTHEPAPEYFTHTDLGLTAFYEGDFEAARREFVRAILADAENAETLMLYGYAHFATGDYLVSALAVRKALRMDPTLIDNPIDIVSLYSSTERFEEHLLRLDAFVMADPDDADARFLAGYIRFAAGMPGAAEEIFEREESLLPNDTLIWMLRTATRRVQQAEDRTGVDESYGPASPGESTDGGGAPSRPERELNHGLNPSSGVESAPVAPQPPSGTAGGDDESPELL
jgi:tetratricopeptide (TPR) repeat protein